MEKVSWIWLGIISLVRVALRFSFVKIDVRSIVSESLEQEVCGKQGTVGRNLMTSRHLVVISLPIINIIQWHVSFP
jgi:hypothetical protein